MFKNRGDGGINIVPCRFRPNVVIGSPEAPPGRRPTLVLAAHAPGFANASAPKNVVSLRNEVEEDVNMNQCVGTGENCGSLILHMAVRVGQTVVLLHCRS